MDGMKILVTGGAGYIGSHTCVELVEAGHEILILDNFCNSSPKVLERLHRILGRELPLVEGDVRDRALVEDVLRRHGIKAVVHFAGLKAVGESVTDPLSYYDANVGGSVALLRAMDSTDVRTLVFSSSATVYGTPDAVPLREDAPLRPMSPYGQTKLMIEDMLRALPASQRSKESPDTPWRIAILRYFNPAGAHASGLIGEVPRGVPNNLMPYLSQVAVGLRDRLGIFGNDYPTRDGTGVRDFIHVMDLARGHLAALAALDKKGDASFDDLVTVNLGTGRGYSVLELVKAFERASGRAIPYTFLERRAGDVGECYADISLSAQVFDWKAEFDLERICVDTWRWQSANPHGYED